MPVVEPSLVTNADLIEVKCTICGKWMKDFVHFIHPECLAKHFTKMIVGDKMGWDEGATQTKYPKSEPFSKWMKNYIKENPTIVDELKNALPEDPISLFGSTGKEGTGDKWDYLDFKPTTEPEEELLNSIRFKKIKPTPAQKARAEAKEQKEQEKLMKLIDKK